MITFAEELLKKNAPLIFIDYSRSQINKLSTKKYALEFELSQEKDEEKKQLINRQIESIDKDMKFFSGNETEDDGWKLVGNEPVEKKKDEDYDFEKEMDEIMAKTKVDIV